MIKIRHTDDLDLIRDLDHDIFQEDDTLSEKLLDRSVWWVAFDGRSPVAYAGLEPEPGAIGTRKGCLCRVGVRSDYRGGGLQRRLILARVRYAQDIGLDRLWTYVSVQNPASFRTLIRCGFLPYFGWEHFIALERHLGGRPQLATRFTP